MEPRARLNLLGSLSLAFPVSWLLPRCSFRGDFVQTIFASALSVHRAVTQLLLNIVARVVNMYLRNVPRLAEVSGQIGVDASEVICRRAKLAEALHHLVAQFRIDVYAVLVGQRLNR